MRATEKQFRDRGRYLVRIDQPARVETTQGVQDVRARGEAILIVRGEDAGRRRLTLERFVLTTTPLRIGRGSSGVISVIARPASGQLRFGRKSDEWEVRAKCSIHYPELDVRSGKEQVTGCYYLPTFLPASVRLAGRVSSLRERSPLGTLQLTVACLAGEGEDFASLTLEQDVRWEVLLPLGGDAGNHDCPTGHQVNRRRLTVQPVGFRNAPGDATPSGSTAPAQLAVAQAVWEKCCIEIVAQPIELITNATLKTSSDLTAIRAAFTDPGADVIEIFFVQNPLVGTGGGNAGAIGVASQKIVVAEPNGGNPVLLAHEIGHALGLLHPPVSDPDTVLDPTGSAMNPGTELVTFEMCSAISQPALETLVATCCTHHDTGDHYIRDFPEDVGAEPSDPLPPGRTRYSMSNVWNRLSATPGTFGPNGPAHEHPARFAADGVTVFTNHLFARVEQTATLPIHDGAVRFYMKHPGSGAGALTLLGEAPVTGPLPRNVSIPWQVPPASPNHSCVFAVVHSPAAPENPTATLDWAAFEALSRNDNDWAQRNLDIRNVAPDGAGNVFAGAPWVIRLDPQVELPASVSLAVDARGARGLEDLVLEVGREEHRLTAGKSHRLELQVDGHLLPVVVRGRVPGRARPGSSFLVQVDPTVNDVQLVGFATELRVTPRHAYLEQLADTLLAACDDLARFADLAPATRIAGLVRDSRCRTTEGTAEIAAKAREPIDELVEALLARPEGKLFGLERARDAWRERLAADDGSGTGRMTLVESLFDLAQRLQLVAWALGGG